MIFRQHREIVAAIAAHDPSKAESAMQQHLRTAFAAIARIASAHAEFFEEETPELDEKSA
jgi:DNA-binding GntR family transcriptional regulator